MRTTFLVLILMTISGLTFGQELATRLGEAQRAYHDKKYEQCIQLLAEVESAQGSFHVYKLLGDAYQKLEKYPEAISAYEKAEKFNESDSELYTHRGAAKISSNNLQSALIDLNKAVQLNAKNTKALYYRGTVNYLLFKNKTAIKDYTACIQIDPNYAASWYMRAASRSEIQQYAGAIDDYAKAYDLDPSLELALFNIAVLKYMKEDYKGALNDFSQLLSSNLKNKDEIYYYRGECFHYTDNKQAACKDYLKAKELGDEEAASIYDKYCLKGMNRGKLPKRNRATGVIAL
jgi:tetratricopeptide (TPR) repeat protein